MSQEADGGEQDQAGRERAGRGDAGRGTPARGKAEHGRPAGAGPSRSAAPGTSRKAAVGSRRDAAEPAPGARHGKRHGASAGLPAGSRDAGGRESRGRDAGGRDEGGRDEGGSGGSHHAATRRGGAKGPTQRQLRVGEEIRHVLAGVFSRAEFRDPELADAQVTVTEVRLSPDLKHATAFVARLGRSDVAALLPSLKRVAPYLRTQVAHALRLRVAPDISFQPDTALEYAMYVDALLHRPEVARDLGAPEPVDGGPPEGDHDRAASGSGKPPDA